MKYELHHGDCLDVLRGMADNSVDSIVTDPPYGLSFMGRKWDYDVPSVEIWAECLRVLKPGGHLLAFAGTRTQHRMACRIEDAGFEIRDMLAWVYGSGFPKSLDVSKAIDKAAGAQREVVGIGSRHGGGRDIKGGEVHAAISGADDSHGRGAITAPATEAAKQWQGWGTALKPALEPITMARKPLAGTVAANVLAHGTGGLNIDGCRVGMSADDSAYIAERIGGFNATKSIGGNGAYSGGETMDRAAAYDASKGRWPANLLHDGSPEVVELFPQTASGKPGTSTRGASVSFSGIGFSGLNKDIQLTGYGDAGSAARFFYCAKASRKDRDEGLDGFDVVKCKTKSGGGLPNDGRSASSDGGMRANTHPTVKPTDLMRYLCRLVTPPGGVVLDPFMGSGSTGKAAMLEDFRFIGIEREAEHIAIARARIEAVQPGLFGAHNPV